MVFFFFFLISYRERSVRTLKRYDNCTIIVQSGSAINYRKFRQQRSFEQQQRIVVVERVRQEFRYPEYPHDPDVHLFLVQSFPEVFLQSGRHRPDGALVAVGRPDVQHELQFLRAVRQHAENATKKCKEILSQLLTSGKGAHWGGQKGAPGKTGNAVFY